MRKLTAGILAHVDAGKTTLSEALLYRGGALRTLGRVDHADAFLDHDQLERERGITIFLKQAVLTLPGLELTLLDTPGHVDFAAEAERTLQVLDCAILVVSAPDGPQGHTLTLWRLLERSGVPVFLFLNKMDQPVDRESLLEKLRRSLSPDMLDMGGYGSESFWESAALGDERALSEYLETGALDSATLRRLISQRKCFPCFFGSALKLRGVDELLEGLEKFAPLPRWGEEFAARVYKISRDEQGSRLTHLKITGGSLQVKASLSLPGGQEKVDQIRVYSGAKFTAPGSVEAGTVCALVGLSSTLPGQALGAESSGPPPALEPAIAYRMLLPEGTEANAVLPKLRELSEEDPQLHLEWNQSLGQITVRLMGKIQAEILKRVISDRFGLDVEFSQGSVVYKETIAKPVEGVGHFEPLRHYAEVHLLLEPLPAGAGVELGTVCSEDDFAGSWQRLVLTHLAEKVYRGVLTGSALTDVRITLVSGRAHLKHTEGGDFRQATYRAVRQGLMKARSILLEPWYSLHIEIPTESFGRALGDIQRMGGEAGAPQTVGNDTVIEASVPVAAFGDYASELATYTKGHGRISCALSGYKPCPNQEAVVSSFGYDPEKDLDDPPGSVFCGHGASFLVPWDKVSSYMHLPALKLNEDGVPFVEATGGSVPSPRESRPLAPLEADKELLAIFERTYGPIKPRAFEPAPRPKRPPSPPSGEGPDLHRPIELPPQGPEYLLVDGYNMIFAWDELNALAKLDLSSARTALADILCNYQGFRQNRIILVFDAYKVPGGAGSVAKYHNIHIVYTKEAETADAYIEKASYQLTKEHRRVLVASADFAEQLIILGHGALRMSAQELRLEVEQANGEIRDILERQALLPKGSGGMREAFRRAIEDKH